ncbi:UNKNOWN [Stylonychia lemnae]|uniref:Uncharacterized protein n=1 Tax=Stylonychia lemnae TaxID=5949 RepID=A0A078A276_STYLE|nr:UNKNOWN [Stylonychia lemnae]|eukprot:CDW75937.1 UNKNOWN [Stylonychia lemnae]
MYNNSKLGQPIFQSELEKFLDTFKSKVPIQQSLNLNLVGNMNKHLLNSISMQIVEQDSKVASAIQLVDSLDKYILKNRLDETTFTFKEQQLELLQEYIFALNNFLKNQYKSRITQSNLKDMLQLVQNNQPAILKQIFKIAKYFIDLSQSFVKDKFLYTIEKAKYLFLEFENLKNFREKIKPLDQIDIQIDHQQHSTSAQNDSNSKVSQVDTKTQNTSQ